ncbi:hypothetical protein C8N43_0342 [Litoreibacter ponti]|uniref:Uncharacterized protein n=1 Tax=Litoreibacter ponti TaxID=1510457 RepID=A0A2T6BI20_9RHOB|nr:hypothetical protein [Litoreibacter ponti]PTX55702.1 hypothetical protein C8N43_0342 [Litoreibacter ponti]
MIRTVLIASLLAAAPAFAADSDNPIKGMSEVSMKVGQSKVIWGWRGECGKRPKGVDPNRTRATKLGVLRNGKWGVFKSRSCGGWTPASEVIFTAKKKGREVIRTQFDQKITITVR